MSTPLHAVTGALGYSGRALADCVAGRKPAVDFAFTQART